MTAAQAIPEIFICTFLRILKDHDYQLTQAERNDIATLISTQQRQQQELEAGAMREALDDVRQAIYEDYVGCYGKFDHPALLERIDALTTTAGKAPLERLEKMRNCGNCKYSPDGDNGCNCIPGDCIERDYEHWQWEGEVSG
jgi:hypothetical protein